MRLVLLVVSLFLCGAQESKAQQTMIMTGDYGVEFDGSYIPAMTKRAARIQRFILREPRAGTDTETPEQRKARARRTAQAIDNVALSRHEVIVLLTIAKHESEHAEFVARGCVLIPATARANCDKGLARSYWQLHEATCRDGWAFQRGDPDSVQTFAACAIRTFRFAIKDCAKKPNLGHLAGGFAGYKTSLYCDWPGSLKRVATYHRIDRTL